MKSLLKAILKPFWRATLPIRRPFTARLEAFFRRCMPVPPPPAVDKTAAEITVVLDHVIRELLRLQDQVALLRETVEDLASDREDASPVLRAKAG